METYIVRIYRRDKNDRRILAGIVEDPGEMEKRVFDSMDDLCNILCPARPPENKRRSRVRSTR